MLQYQGRRCLCFGSWEAIPLYMRTGFQVLAGTFAGLDA